MADWTKGLTGDQKNAFTALNSLFTNYGLGTLAPKIVDFIKQGYSADTINLLLQQTTEYKQRFKANEVRRAKGLPVLSPAEYLATETAYRQIMRASGLPKGFYDQPQDFQKFLEQDVSPTEIQSRVQAAADFIDSASPEEKAVFGKWYTNGDMIAYALDPNRAAPLVEKAFRTSQVGGAAAQQGLDINKELAQSIAETGVNEQQASQGMAMVANTIGNDQKLAAISGDSINAYDLMRETFLNDQTVTTKRDRLASQERARFGGSSAVGSGSLGSSSSGRL